MQKKSNNKTFIWFFLAGFLLKEVGAFSLIHEAGHALFGNGRIDGWALATIRYTTPAEHFIGSAGGMLLILLVFGLIMYRGRRNVKVFAFCAAVLFSDIGGQFMMIGLPYSDISGMMKASAPATFLFMGIYIISYLVTVVSGIAFHRGREQQRRRYPLTAAIR